MEEVEYISLAMEVSAGLWSIMVPDKEEPCDKEGKPTK
jgi:hypothetical protein